MVTAAVEYLVGHPATLLRQILFLGYNQREYRALEDVLRAMHGVVAAVPRTPTGDNG